MTRPPLGAANEGQPVPLSLEGGSVVDGEVQLEAAGSTTSIYPYGQFRQDVAYNDLALVNQTRSSVGARTLTWSKELENVAKQRAVETAVYWSHTRPNGTSCFTAFESGHGYWNASAISGTTAPTFQARTSHIREAISRSTTYTTIGSILQGTMRR